MAPLEIQKLLDDYAATSRAFSDAVERLRHLNADGEAFINALAEAGTARRACERSRLRLDRQMSQLRGRTAPEGSFARENTRPPAVS